MSHYNPHITPRAELIESFSVRLELLDELVADLRRGGSQHHLIVGERGAGKTTLLLRLAAAIEDDPKLVKTCVPLRFPEEQYNVANLADVWMNAVDSLIDALERAGQRAAATALEAALEEVEKRPDDARADAALAMLEGWIAKAKRSVVLLVDNFDLILERLSEPETWGVREALSKNNRIVLVAASSRFLDQSIDYKSAFYEFLHIHQLAALTEAEAERLVRTLARRSKSKHVEDVLANDPGRFRALFVLSGGAPRTLALLYAVLARDSSDNVEQDLELLLDQVTPYYKARFDDLPTQSQLVVDKVALHWDPITAAECARETRLKINVVSAQLDRLVKSGVLAKVDLGESKLGFQIAERFFNIWYLMRASRRMRRKPSWYVRLVRVLYGETELERRGAELANATGAREPGKLLAFASAVSSPGLRTRLEGRAVAMLIESRQLDAIELDGEDEDLRPMVDRIQAMTELRRKLVKRHRRELAESVASSAMLSMREKLRIASASTIDPATRARLDDTLDATLHHAVARGDIPALPDVFTVREVHDVIGVSGNHRDTAAVLAAVIALLRPGSRDLLCEVASVHIGGYLFGVASLMKRGWELPAELVTLALGTERALPDDGIDSALWFASQAITFGHEAKLLALSPMLQPRPLWELIELAIRKPGDDSAGIARLAPERQSMVHRVRYWIDHARESRSHERQATRKPDA